MIGAVGPRQELGEQRRDRTRPTAAPAPVDRERRDLRVVALVDDAPSVRTAGRPGTRASVRRPATAAPGRRDPLGVEAEGAGHPEVQDQLEALVEGRYQELAPATDVLDRSTFGALEVDELARIDGYGVVPDLSDGAAAQLGIELAPDRFDLGQLGHPVRLFRVPEERPLPYAIDNLPKKDDIGADFFDVDMRVGRVVEVSRLPGGPQARMEADRRLRPGRRHADGPAPR